MENNKENSEVEKKAEAENKNLDAEEIFVPKKQIRISLVGLIFIIMFILFLIVVGVAFATNKETIGRNFLESTNTNNDDDKPRNSTRSNYIKHTKTDITDMFDEKPIIYIYPEEETKVEVKLGRPELLTTTYPKYEEGWQVIASPDGTLKDCKTKRELYALYWEGQNSKNYNNEEEEGFIIPGEETAKFLEEKLEILGLNEREAEEFIVYWLPQMEHNKYNYIRFQTMEEIEENMPLEITPAPKTIIRVMMEWKALDEKIKIKEQQLEKVERKGYTVVEWGGTEIKSNGVIK